MSLISGLKTIWNATQALDDMERRVRNVEFEWHDTLDKLTALTKRLAKRDRDAIRLQTAVDDDPNSAENGASSAALPRSELLRRAATLKALGNR